MPSRLPKLLLSPRSESPVWCLSCADAESFSSLDVFIFSDDVSSLSSQLCGSMLFKSREKYIVRDGVREIFREREEEKAKLESIETFWQSGEKSVEEFFCGHFEAQVGLLTRRRKKEWLGVFRHLIKAELNSSSWEGRRWWCEKWWKLILWLLYRIHINLCNKKKVEVCSLCIESEIIICFM